MGWLGRWRMPAAFGLTVALFGAAVASFVVRPSPAVAVVVALEEPVSRTAAPREQTYRDFPAGGALPLKARDPARLQARAGLSMRRGDAVNVLTLEMHVPESDALVYAVTDALVQDSWTTREGTLTVRFRSTNGYEFEYSNLARVRNVAGQAVEQGEPVGTAAPPAGGVGSRLWYEVHTGQRYFPTARFGWRPAGSYTAWVLEVGPDGRVSTREVYP